MLHTLEIYFILKYWNWWKVKYLLPWKLFILLCIRFLLLYPLRQGAVLNVTSMRVFQFELRRKSGFYGQFYVEYFICALPAFTLIKILSQPFLICVYTGLRRVINESFCSFHPCSLLSCMILCFSFLWPWILHLITIWDSSPFFKEIILDCISMGVSFYCLACFILFVPMFVL